MAGSWQRWDGAIFGALTGVLLGFPTWATKINSWIASIIPAGWTAWSSYSLAIYIIALFALIGYIVDRTK